MRFLPKTIITIPNIGTIDTLDSDAFYPQGLVHDGMSTARTIMRGPQHKKTVDDVNLA